MESTSCDNECFNCLLVAQSKSSYIPSYQVNKESKVKNDDTEVCKVRQNWPFCVAHMHMTRHIRHND